MHSQNDEEKYILEYFGGKSDGRFLDIGAGDGVAFSNTKALYDRGWAGVALEPSPSLYPALEQNWPRTICLQCALAETRGPVQFYDAGGDFVSTLSQQHRDEWQGSGSTYTEITVDGVTWEYLDSTFGTDFDFLNLDIERMSAIMFAKMPPAYLERLDCLCIEHDFQVQAIEQRTAPHGFKRLALNAENLILVK